MFRRAALLCGLMTALTTSAWSQTFLAGDTPDDQGGYMGQNKDYGRLRPGEGTILRSKFGPMIYGIDISYYQTVTSWATLAANQAFVVMRSSYGQNSYDTSFASFRASAEANNIPIGFYHYAYPSLGNTAAAEANNFCNRVGSLKAGQFAVLDMEDTAYTGDWVTWAKAWLDAVYARLGTRPLIYMSLSVNNSYNWAPVVNANYGLWLARWDYNKTAAAPTTDWPFCAMRQYSDRETIAGISGTANCDADVFYGTIDQLKAYGAQPPTVAWTAAPASHWYNSNESYSYHCAGRGTLTVKTYVDGTLTSTSATADGAFSLAGLSDNAWHDIYVVVTDGFGLTATSTHQVFGRDSVAPSASVTSGTPGTWYRTATNVTFTGSDAKSGLKQTQYAWDSGAFSAWSTSATTSVPLHQGKHRLYAKTEDNSYTGANATGNAQVVDLGEFWLDTAMPTLNAEGHLVSNRGAIQVELAFTNPNISPAESVVIDGIDLNGVAATAPSWTVGTVPAGATVRKTFSFSTSFGTARSLPAHATVHIGGSSLNRTVTINKL